MIHEIWCGQEGLGRASCSGSMRMSLQLVCPPPQHGQALHWGEAACFLPTRKCMAAYFTDNGLSLLLLFKTASIFYSNFSSRARGCVGLPL